MILIFLQVLFYPSIPYAEKHEPQELRGGQKGYIHLNFLDFHFNFTIHRNLNHS